jgi:hypothetical protein
LRLLVSCLLGLTLLAAPAFAQHMHQLEYNNSSWVDTDLTAATGGPTVLNIGVAAYQTTANGQTHVFYVQTSDDETWDVHQMWFDGTNWHDEDLTVETGGASAYNGTGLSGFAIGNAQYLYFCDGSFNVHQFAYGDGGNWNWVDTNLNAVTGKGYPGTCADYADSMAAIVTANGNRHIFFQGPDKNDGKNAIREFLWNGREWSIPNLTTQTKGATGYGTWMSAFAINYGSYLFFQGNNGHIQEYSYLPVLGYWVDTDVTVAAGGVPAGTFEANGPGAFAVPGKDQIEVYYSTGEEVHQMTYKNKKWSDQDLGGPAPYSLGPILAYATTPNNQFHVYYNGQGGNVIDQMYFNGTSWSYGALPSAQVAGLGPGMAGFSVGNFQYVYYISAE